MNNRANKMDSEKVKQFALDLLHADSESEVVKLLKDAGYWDNPSCWRLLGDDENNFKTVGAQAAYSTSALVEKVVNSIDARLVSECIKSGISPSSSDAPKTIAEAKARFFDNIDRTELAKGITLSVTGARAQQNGMPCITICDIGEGQTPTDVPNTFMSIDRKNKLRIPFVQGKFNMGGTGALMFCGKQKLQLLITKRDPGILKHFGVKKQNDSHWSVTVVRRETPPEGPGQVRNPYFKYLAPIGSEDKSRHGDILSFDEDFLTLMPEANNAYARPVSWGSCIKLYEYDMRGFKGHILRTDGLLSKLEVLLPEIALPIRMHECRKGLRGHAASFDTNLVGLRERLESSRWDNIEPGYPASLTLNVQGQPMTARIYAFKDNNADRYRADQGVVFTINGQTHGWFPKSFFERKHVKMGRLAKALLIVVDASDISVDARADLFKNSRDRLSGGELRRDIEEELESQIANHPGLRELRERRRREEVAEKLDEAKPLEDVLRQIIKTSPSLSKLFLLGQRLSSPYRSGGVGKFGGSGGDTAGKGNFEGKKHPTYFRFDKLKKGETLERTSELGRRCRIRFVTDVDNEYFARDSYRGRYYVEVVDGVLAGRELTTSVNLYNGVANWSIAIPEEDVDIGDILFIKFVVEDDVLVEPFVNYARISMSDNAQHERGKGSGRHERSGGDSEKPGDAGSNKGKSGRNKEGPPIGISMPNIHKVHRDGWSQYDFDEYSACTMIEENASDLDDDQSVYEFYINIDNLYLQTDMKQGRNDPAIAEAKFIYGNVLIGLALIHDQKKAELSQNNSNNQSPESEEEPIARRIEAVTRALSPFLVPMVEYLGGLESEEVYQLAQVGDEM